MKIVVIGGTGLIGSKTVAILRQRGHEVLAASPNSGVNTITGEGLKEALAGAQVVIDLANSPSFEDKAVLEFFETSGRNLLAAEAAAGGVRHHVALSIVGIDRSDNGYFAGMSLTKPEVATLLRAAEPTWLYLPVLVAVTTGMRRGELLGLRWSDIDLKAAWLTVNQSLERVKGKTVFKSPKTTTSRRTITLPALTIEALKEHRAAQAAERLRLGLGKPELVFRTYLKIARRSRSAINVG